MASTYVNDLRLNEMATGDGSGTWGTTTNTNLELIAEAFSYGTEVITTNADTHTTTIADGATDPGRSLYLKYTGTLDSACTITIGPNTVSKVWIIENGTSGSQNIIISQGSGANITIPAGDTKVVYSDGAGAGAAFFDAFTDLNVGAINGIESKAFGTGSIMIGDATTGTIDAADYNTGLGVDVFAALTTGDYNTALGYGSLQSTTEGEQNTAVGRLALRDNTTGTLNVAMGVNALLVSTTGNRNIAIGTQALTANTTADNNTAVGHQSLLDNTTGANNVGIGIGALKDNTEGATNTALGSEALNNNTTASNNVAIGADALYTNTTGASNVAVGAGALDANTTASSNTAVGYDSLGANTTGNTNTAVGQTAGSLITTGSANTIIGRFNGNQHGLDIRTGSNYVVLSDGAGHTSAYWRKSIINIPFNSFTTFFTIPTTEMGVYTIVIGLDNQTTSDWCAYAVIKSAGSPAVFITNSGSTQVTLQISGLDVQVKQVGTSPNLDLQCRISRTV
jgi:trimeric autotransporter adhesin